MSIATDFEEWTVHMRASIQAASFAHQYHHALRTSGPVSDADLRYMNQHAGAIADHWYEVVVKENDL